MSKINYLDAHQTLYPSWAQSEICFAATLYTALGWPCLTLKCEPNDGVSSGLRDLRAGIKLFSRSLFHGNFEIHMLNIHWEEARLPERPHGAQPLGSNTYLPSSVYPHCTVIYCRGKKFNSVKILKIGGFSVTVIILS